jgi:hypothetical protein
MENTEQLNSTERESLPLLDTESKSVNGGVARHMPAQRREIAAQALKELWQELKFDGNPLLLDQLVANGKQRKKSPFGQLKSWELLSAPPYAQGIAAIEEVSTLLKADMLRPADIGERGTIPAAPLDMLYLQ